MTLHPSVYVDEHFTAEEVAGIWTGLHAWEAAVAEVHFTPVNMAYDDARTEAVTHNADDTVFIFRDALATEDCPYQLGDSVVGETFWVHPSSTETICFLADYVNANGARWAAITQHEMGHALGLQHGGTDGQGHLPPPAAMATPYDAMSDHIECNDLVAITEAWGLAPPRCQ